MSEKNLPVITSKITTSIYSHSNSHNVLQLPESGDDHEATTGVHVEYPNHAQLQSSTNGERKMLTPKEFRKSVNETTIIVDAKNNLYFILFSDKVASFMVYKVVLSKRYLIITSILMFLIGLIDIFTSTNTDKSIINGLISFIFNSVIFFNCVIYALSLNLDICFLIFTKFDFWFKMVNLIGFIISDLMTEDDLINIHWLAIYLRIALISLLLIIFMIDAMLFLNTKIKIILLVLLGFGCTLRIIVNFFEIEDTYSWNPFKSYNFDETNINWKSMYISSLTNMAIFIMKPVFTIFGSYCKHKIKKFTRRRRKTTISNVDANVRNRKTSDAVVGMDKDGALVVRSLTVFSKPYFKWENVSVTH